MKAKWNPILIRIFDLKIVMDGTSQMLQSWILEIKKR